MRNLYTAFFLLMTASQLAAQDDSTFQYSEKLILDFPLADFPYMKYAAGMAYNKRTDQLSSEVSSPTFGDYLRSYESPSMGQALAVTKNLHATNYFYQNKLWNNWLSPTTKKRKFYNRLAANASAGLVDYILAYQLMVFSPVWNHEEFHRNGLTLEGIPSFDETYFRFGGGIPSGSVSKVKDEDMVRFKAVAPVAMVRSFASGIESQYALLRNMQKDDFFDGTEYANVAMHILVTNQAVGYVNQFRSKDYDASIDTMNYYGETIAERDFVGWDFTPWVYDLFRPNEPYGARGTHPSGVGIDRAIKRSDLTPEEDAYLVQMGKLQYINFITPFMIGLKKIKINDHTSFNFALRHFPTAFGYSLSADVFLKRHDRHWLLALHTFHNKDNVYPGVEIYQPEMFVRIAKRKIPLQTRLMSWVQPKNESFYASSGKFGGLVSVRASYPINKFMNFYLEAEGKSRGWVAANPFLKANFTTRMGVWISVNKL